MLDKAHFPVLTCMQRFTWKIHDRKKLEHHLKK